MAAAEALMNHGIVNSIVVVTPASLIANYNKELSKFHARTEKYAVMSFEAFTKKPESGSIMTKDKLLIVDEAHNLRNASGRRSKALYAQTKGATKVLLLTGTPI
jgi:SNF2 family DNA or RNA helicase